MHELDDTLLADRVSILRRFIGRVCAFAVIVLLCGLLLAVRANAQAPSLSSWNEGVAKQAIMAFVREVTDQSSPKYVQPADRIATFDQDGTLWVEHPLYTQAVFALDRVHELAPQHPEWNQQEPFKAVLANDPSALAGFSEPDWETLVAATHTGMSTEAFGMIVKQWLARAKHPRFHRRYTDLVYQPMLEVFEFLRANEFKTYIVTGVVSSSSAHTVSAYMGFRRNR